MSSIASPMIPGVSQINMFGPGGPSMRVWLDPLAMAARNLTVTDIEDALRRENLELPAGTRRIARPRLSGADRAQLSDGRRLPQPRDRRKGADGHLVRLGEVADVEVGPRRDRSGCSGRTAAHDGLRHRQAVDGEHGRRARRGQGRGRLASTTTCREGMQLITSGDDSLFIRAAIEAVYWTIAITTALVGPRDLRVSRQRARDADSARDDPGLSDRRVLGAGAVRLLASTSITLLALVLSIGLVVDDSIVVLENAHRRIEEGEPPLLAAFNGTRQVAFAVIATTVVLVSVFAPVAFLKDSIGRIFAELAVTMSAAVIFSSMLALSLTPMMCSKLLHCERERKPAHALARQCVRLDVGQVPGAAARARSGRRGSSVGVVRAACVRRLRARCRMIPQEYAPPEDQGQFNGMIQAAEGIELRAISREAHQGRGRR